MRGIETERREQCGVGFGISQDLSDASMRKKTLLIEKLLEVDTEIVPAGSSPQPRRNRSSSGVPNSAGLLLLLGMLLAVVGQPPTDTLLTISQRSLRSNLQAHRQPLYHLQSVP